MIVDWKYTNSVEIGQPKLSEWKIQRSGLFGSTYKSYGEHDSSIEDYGLEYNA